MLIPPLDLVSRVRRGEINLDRLVEILRTRGYITEEKQENGCGFGKSAMEAVHQDELDALFSFFFPQEICDIKVSCVATDEGSDKGAYSYALFNSNVINREEVLAVLRSKNEKTHAWLHRKI